jgi:hypothetical protein
MPFHPLTLGQFAELLERFPFTRRINAVHMHHTWSPRRADYRGLDSIVGMWRYHTRECGWSDIAQHLTIAPDGTLWTGRGWNSAPASASGHNGTSKEGPFMFEMIGNFDHGHDRFEGPQREAALEVIARVQERFGLAADSLRFHREMSSKTCPGSAIDRAEMVAAVRRVREELRLAVAAKPPARELPFGAREVVDTEERELVLGPMIETLTRPLPLGAEKLEAEDPHAPAPTTTPGAPFRAAAMLPGGDAAAAQGKEEFPPEVIRMLRPHVINLTQGRFSSDGVMQTTPSDVDALFREHLPRALEATRDRGEPRLKLLFYAHGGLVSEKDGLRKAKRLTDWWMQNGVYPVFFVWETGLSETLSALLGGQRGLERDLAARGLSDISDHLLERAARAAGGARIWGGMKYGAERSVGRGGGARVVAERLAEFAAAHADEVELHAVGHSAGAIFHSYFVPAALERGAPSFRSLCLLAPAIRTDAFLERFEPILGAGKGVERLHLFNLDRDHERRDHCAGVYGKSLLHLVSNAFEPARGQPLLGLEESVRADERVAGIFGLAGREGAVGEVVWAPTVAIAGRAASRAVSHGGFDDDRATMESVLRRVLDCSDEAAIAPFPAEVKGPRAEPHAVEALHLHGGHQRALCIGIDRYRSAPLQGCVADAELWARTFEGLGFETTLLADGEATRASILAALRAMVAASAPGDVLVFQYAGHGTHFEDSEGDEEDGQDEALVPFDYEAGRFVLDDEQRELFAALPEGVNLTCFYDCCHSGTMARVALDNVLHAARDFGAGEPPRMRFLDPTPEMLRAYHEMKKSRRARGRALAPERRPAIAFGACRDDEVALEQGGQGLFTGHAVRLLKEKAGSGISHEEFHRQVVAAFGARPPQHPELDCAIENRARALLQPLAPAAYALVLPPALRRQLLERAGLLPRAELESLVRELNALLGAS